MRGGVRASTLWNNRWGGGATGVVIGTKKNHKRRNGSTPDHPSHNGDSKGEPKSPFIRLLGYTTQVPIGGKALVHSLHLRGGRRIRSHGLP